MQHGSQEEIQKQVRIYIAVFVALAALTVITVAISYLKLPLIPAVSVALFIATLKGSLVALFFMHLISEKQIIFSVLALTFVFFLFLLILPVLS